jgi:hypothetical protein
VKERSRPARRLSPRKDSARTVAGAEDGGLERIGGQVRRELEALRARCGEQLTIDAELEGFGDWVRSLPERPE